MTANDTTARQGKEADAPFTTTKTVYVPVHVPEEIEDAAREDVENVRANSEAVNAGPYFDGLDDRTDAELLDVFLGDYITVVPQFLTRDVQHDDHGEAMTRPVYAPLTEDVHAELVDAASEDTRQAWVRDAIRLRLALDNSEEMIAELQEDGL